jgi:hypothetical protein
MVVSKPALSTPKRDCGTSHRLTSLHDHGPVVDAVVVGSVVVGSVVGVVVGGGGGAGAVVLGDGFLFVAAGPVVAVVVGGVVAGVACVDVVPRGRVDVASARVGTAGGEECVAATMTAATSPLPRRAIPANA